MKRELLVATSMTACAVGMVAAPAYAQTPTAQGVPATDDALVEDSIAPRLDTAGERTEIVITGSRIPSPNLTSTSPITSFGQDEIRFQGAASVETVLQSLPGVTPAINGGSNAQAASGTATIALRNLGAFRTLVLVDGHRLMPGDPVVPAPDLKNIPTSLVRRVEVVTGGASAVYGSDAVAGVVNFIMDRNLNGIRVDGQFGFAWHNNNNEEAQGYINAFNASRPAGQAEVVIPGNRLDAWQTTASIALGTNIADGRGNITVYATYTDISPLSEGRRDYGACLVGTVATTPPVLDRHACVPNANSQFGRFLNFNLANNPNGTRTFVPFTADLGFNQGPFTYYQQADRRYTAGYFAHYEVSPALEIYSDLMFVDDSQESQAAPSGLFFNNGVHAINCDNPLMSAAQAAVICGPNATVVNGVSINQRIGYRIENSRRVKYLDHTSFLAGLGARGALSSDWNYDLRLQYGRTNYDQRFAGDFSNRLIDEALNVIAGPNGPICANAAARTQGCVPLDIFQALGAGISPDAIRYISATGFKEGDTTETVASLNISGDLGRLGIQSPWADRAAAVAFGAEYRRETLDLSVDQEFGTGDLAGGGGVQPGASGRFDVKEIYGEIRFPLVSDRPFLEDLSIDVGYRYSDYSIAGQTDAYKLSAEWAPTRDIRIRGGYNRAVRAPNIIDLFSPQVITLSSFNDPCAGAGGLSVSGCVNTFASPAIAAIQLGTVPACAQSQCNQLIGAPTDPRSLQPEEADTYTIGFVLTPRWINNFNLSVDWYKIRINNPIVPGIGAALIVSQCINSSLYCDLINRDPTSGALFGGTLANGYVANLSQNSGFLDTRGIDISANYRVRVGRLGSLSTSFSGTYTERFVRQPAAGAATYDCGGLFGLVCLQPLPTWKHQARLTWETPVNVNVSLNWRHLSAVSLDANTSDPSLAVRGTSFVDTADGRIPAYDYFDLATTWRVRSGIRLRAGINNIFDRDPPILDGGGSLGIAGPIALGNGNTFPGVYDSIGRTVFFGITADF